MRLRRLLACGLLFAALPARADAPLSFDLTIKDHKFEPAELAVPAGKPFIVKIKNLDPMAEEVESGELHFEKTVAGNGDGVLHIHPLDPGRHDFIGEYHAVTARGAFVAR